MADDTTWEAAMDAVESALVAVAKKAEVETSSSYALKWAAATAQLAEARAWLRSPTQAHGSMSVPD